MAAATPDRARTDRVLKLLAKGPVDLTDDHAAVPYLLIAKHDHPITCTLHEKAVPGRWWRPPGSDWRTPHTWIPKKPLTRRWRLLEGYTREQVHAERNMGHVDAAFFKATIDQYGHADALLTITDPVRRDAAADRLRNWQ